MKKLLSVILSLIMMFSLGAVCVNADSGLDTSVALEMETGAAIRLGEINGIRYYTRVDEAAQAQLSDLIDAGYTVELGTLIAPLDLLGENELSFELDSKSYLDVNYLARNSKGKVVYYNDGTDFEGFVGSITNIKLSTASNFDNGNKKRDFVARGYVKVTDENGVQTISYASYADGDIANNTRRLYDIANEYKNDADSGYNDLDAATKALVDQWAEWIVYSPRY